MSRVKELIRRIKSESNVFGDQELALISGVVVEINRDERLLSVKTEEGVEISQVMMSSMLNSNSSIIVYPKINSECLVLVELLSNISYLIGIEEVEEIKINLQNIKVQLNEKEININGGNNGGILNIEGVTKRFNEIEKDINKLKEVFQLWMPQTQDGGASLKTAVESWSNIKVEMTKREDYEDKKIKH